MALLRAELWRRFFGPRRETAAQPPQRTAARE